MPRPFQADALHDWLVSTQKGELCIAMVSLVQRGATASAFVGAVIREFVVFA